MKTSLLLIGSLGVLGWVTGCNLLPEPQVDPVRYFTLGTPSLIAPVAGAPVVRPVQLAPYLRGRKFAVRVAEHEVAYLDDLNWAAPLDDAILSVLRNRLARVSGGAVISVQIQRCELSRYQGDTVQFSATYTVVTMSGESPRERHGLFVAPMQHWEGKSYAQLVDLISRAVDGLAEKLASEAVEK